MLLCRSCCRQPVLSRTGMPCLLQQYEVIRKAAEKRENSSVCGIGPYGKLLEIKTSAVKRAEAYGSSMVFQTPHLSARVILAGRAKARCCG